MLAVAPGIEMFFLFNVALPISDCSPTAEMVFVDVMYHSPSLKGLNHCECACRAGEYGPAAGAFGTGDVFAIADVGFRADNAFVVFCHPDALVVVAIIVMDGVVPFGNRRNFIESSICHIKFFFRENTMRRLNRFERMRLVTSVVGIGEDDPFGFCLAGHASQRVVAKLADALAVVNTGEPVQRIVLEMLFNVVLYVFSEG